MTNAILGSVSLTLPAPPSVNAMYRNVAGRGRVKTAKYLAWQKEAGRAIGGQLAPRTCGPVGIVLSIDRPRINSDIDNHVKAVFDFLVEKGIIDDDKNVVGFCASWAPKSDKKEVRVTVMPALIWWDWPALNN